MCGRRLGKNFLTLLQHWSGAVMCPACLCGGETAGHNAIRGSGPNQKHAFKDALTQAGSPDPRIDLVCITSSCPRQFRQSFSSYVGSGFTSLVALAFNATTIALRYRGAGAVHSIRSGHDALKPRCPLYPRKQTLRSASRMSALGQTATYAVQQKCQLFDHLVCTDEQPSRHAKAERLGGLEVDDQLVLGRCLHWKVGGCPPSALMRQIGRVEEGRISGSS